MKRLRNIFKKINRCADGEDHIIRPIQWWIGGGLGYGFGYECAKCGKVWYR